jgi:hypothetical protein
MRASLASSLLGLAAGHGQVTIPVSRNGGTTATAGGCPNLESSNGHDICSWMTNGINIVPPETLPKDFITTGPDAQFCTTNPWRKPGSIPIQKPCGHVGGKDGRDLPMTTPTVVKAGGDLEVAWAINANHGGGYSYRLCPSSPTATEECFQKTILRASASNRDTAFIQQGEDKSSRQQIPMMRLTNGTFPEGSEWTRNPIPDRDDYFPAPAPGLVGHGPFPWSIVESYAVPAELAPGPYLLSWRWDCEGSPQIWLNCADVTVVGDGPTPPTPAPAPPVPTPKPPAPTPSPGNVCTAQTSSSRDCGWMGVNQQQCENQGCCWKPLDPNPGNLPWCFYKDN